VSEGSTVTRSFVITSRTVAIARSSRVAGKAYPAGRYACEMDASDGWRDALYAWYRPRATMYPWRRQPNPYRVLVSEVMLQQTQASRVAPAFERFVAAFPSVGSLAAAPAADVLRSWDGLGYNRRALALHRAARAIVRDHGSVV